MRLKNKIYCSKCGKFLWELSKKQMDKINKDRAEGTRINCGYYCNKCSGGKNG